MFQKIKLFFYRLMRSMPMRKNNVLLFSYYGEHYSGSPKYISQYLIQNSSLKIVWAFTKPENYSICDSKKIKYNSFKFYYYLATSGSLVTNYRMPSFFEKREKQKYIQTWHSSLRLKMIEKDAESTLPSNYVTMAKNDSKQISVLLAGSKKSKEIFEKAFWYDGRILNSGTPQCDLFFNNTDFYVKKVREFYKIDDDTKIALYAPTFRKNNNLDIYDLDYDDLVKNLQNKFGGEWVILLRLHPHLIHADLNLDSNVTVNATSYDDVQELLCAADILISDYSAIMFDYMCLKRPCFLYIPDYQNYISNDRKLYFDLDDLPFETAETKEELNLKVYNFDFQSYNQKLNQFLDEIGSFDDGHACERVLKEIVSKNNFKEC